MKTNRNYYRGFTRTANGFALHYTWSEAMQAYVNDMCESDTYKDIPQSTFRCSVTVDEWR